ncbi:hypothetical protein CBM2633_B10488 [Cupriavidus taiwanensis]|uniref:Uncharacterized protein n=1 Tax=Cupriavidus taiwanensis TaxID=164546 RepID=A0A976B1G9_9BURK|nr:hypothetical protein CBM2604_B130103 [Cupriavidus taiwanensis]SOZ31144.1 hypothetical protein CBM2609_B120103 [Cupriavidus taiwanensis]SOZ47220.1 hypothetical protein CBM2610_B100102 [Cupriavidus taiwanensis]SOZ66332.1 hypothetical protein CBM2614_B200175 [Cupriavidus taiwanensis]SOZ67169.1 hypothetical protein CBM2615_B190173 [Cupriavidus taiwanensis]
MAVSQDKRRNPAQTRAKPARPAAYLPEMSLHWQDPVLYAIRGIRELAEFRFSEARNLARIRVL